MLTGDPPNRAGCARASAVLACSSARTFGQPQHNCLENYTMIRGSAVLLTVGALVGCRSGSTARLPPKVDAVSHAECVVLVQAPQLATWGPVAGDTLQLLPAHSRSGMELGGC